VAICFVGTRGFLARITVLYSYFVYFFVHSLNGQQILRRFAFTVLSFAVVINLWGYGFGFF